MSVRERARPAHLRGVRDPGRAGPVARPGAQPDRAARARLGRQRLPRPAHHRRAHPPPAREARARLAASPSSSSPCAAWATASRTADPRAPAPLPPQQAGVALLRHHGRRVRGHLLRRGAAARVQPRGPAAAGPAPLGRARPRAARGGAGGRGVLARDQPPRSHRPGRHRRARDPAELGGVLRGPAGPGPRAPLLSALRLARGRAGVPARRRPHTPGGAERPQPERLRHASTASSSASWRSRSWIAASPPGSRSTRRTSRTWPRR